MGSYLHSHLAALWNRLGACTDCSIVLAVAAGIVLLDAVVGLSEVGLLVAVAILVPLYEELDRRRDGTDDAACCESC